MPVLKPLLYLMLVTSLASCAASKSVRNGEDIIDDGKRNSIVLSYEIRLDTYDRFPGYNRTELALRCGPVKSINPFPVCFYLKASFAGKREENDFIVNSFEASGAKVYQIKYGDYSLARASYSVVVGQRRDRICYPSKKYRRYRCYDEYVDVKSSFATALPQVANFNIGAGDGCYLGHLTLHLRGGKIVNYELDTSFSEEKLLLLPERTRASAQVRVKSSCIS